MKNEISIPKPHRLQDGRYSAQLMIDGERFYVYGNTLAEYRKNVIVAKTERRVVKVNDDFIDLATLIGDYIETNANVLSPSTIRGYDIILRCRFNGYLNQPIDKINWQKMISDESIIYSAKSVKNGWALISKVLKQNKIEVPSVNLPTVMPNEMSFLDYEQIKIFIKAIYNTKVELPALLALHSLRMSEIKGLERGDISHHGINVNKAMVTGLQSLNYIKPTKTIGSTRVIPIIIPRVLEIVPDNSGYITSLTQRQIEYNIDKACRESGLPEVGCHGLRRSFSSLAYHLGWNERTTMLIGGWTNIQTVHKHYIKLATKDIDKDIKLMQDYFKIT